jgi:hypothetical protein
MSAGAEPFFEQVLGRAFQADRREVLPSGTRMFYHARRR